ncbi:MAG: peptidoglycan-binding domain-containing protein [Actinomycetota bacterium]
MTDTKGTTDQTTGDSTEQPKVDSTGAARIKFLTSPRIVVSEDGVRIKVSLVNVGDASIDVSFRLSFRGRLLDIDAPALSLRAGHGPVQASISVPIDSGIGRGAKVGVQLIGPDGSTIGVSSTGVVTVKTPRGRTLAIGKSGVTAVGVTVGGAALLWAVGARPGPPEPGPEPVVSADVEVVDDPDESADGDVAVEPVDDALQVVVPDGLLLEVSDSQLTGIDGINRGVDVEVSLALQFERTDAAYLVSASGPDGSIFGPLEFEIPRSFSSSTEAASWSSSIVVDLDRSVTARLVLVDCVDDVTNDLLAPYQLVDDVGSMELELGLAHSGADFVVDASLRVSAEVVLGDTDETIDPVRCPARGTRSLSWTSTGAAVSEFDSTADDHAGSGVDSTDDEASSVEPADGESADDGAPVDDSGGAEYVAEPASGVLRLGHVGERVEALQRALVERGFPDLAIDGQFGPATQDAVRAFQADEGLEVDGFAGPQTHAALELEYAA